MYINKIEHLYGDKLNKEHLSNKSEYQAGYTLKATETWSK